MNRFDELVEKAAMRYTRATLPSHPAWCERSEDPRDACAMEGEDGLFAMATHTSIGQIQDSVIPDVYLERSDLAGWGPGEIEIGISLEEDGRDMTLRVPQARVFAEAILVLCQRADHLAAMASSGS